jgi:peptidoglycan/xylan/chitin deacetylase (PgdA/CDA1 family)
MSNTSNNIYQRSRRAPFTSAQADKKPVRARFGAMVISLDFELHWGVRDHTSLDEAEGARLLAARTAIPRILDLFDEFSICATWATVGLLFARSKKEAEVYRPAKRPNYRDAQLDPYRERLGDDERSDPFHFAPSIIAQIAERRGQEIASHSFSHYYCMEAGQSGADFEADLKSAIAIAANSGYTLRSYVFPRNQVNVDYLASLQRSGIRAYRGNEPVLSKRAAPFALQRRVWNRIARLSDSCIDLYGDQTSAWPPFQALTSIPASRYLRPYRPAFHRLQSLFLRRIRKAMKHAAEHAEIFHLWWHPEDFAASEHNLLLLRQVLEMFDNYRTQCGMVSLSMSDVVTRVDRDHDSVQLLTGTR